jgi:hypothetical protein
VAVKERRDSLATGITEKGLFPGRIPLGIGKEWILKVGENEMLETVSVQ